MAHGLPRLRHVADADMAFGGVVAPPGAPLQDQVAERTVAEAANARLGPFDISREASPLRKRGVLLLVPLRAEGLLLGGVVATRVGERLRRARHKGRAEVVSIKICVDLS